MFPAPDKVPPPGLSCGGNKLEETARHLIEKLSDGVDCEEEVMGYCVSGGQPDGRLLFASLGNRLAGKKPCPRSLTVLLAMDADPKVVHPQIGPAVCWAARNGDVGMVERLVGAGADIEALDPDNSPALKAAIIAGAAAVAMKLIALGANVQWRHHDDANYLHVLTSWLCDGDAAGMNRRMAPVDNEPAELVSMLIYHGVDPIAKQKWEGKGLTAYDTWRARKETCPWLEDERSWQTFPTVARALHKTWCAAAEAMEQKAKANSLLKNGKFDEACQTYALARNTLAAADIGGHHVASLWSNEAICRKKMGDAEGCRTACEEGLRIFECEEPGKKLYCSDSIRKKLEFNLAEPEQAGKDAEVAEAPTANSVRPKPTNMNFKAGFFNDCKSEMYGPEGSRNGEMPKTYKQPINGGEAVVDVKINQPGGANLHLFPPMEFPNPDDKEDKEADKVECTAKDV